jgi:hypothetical protein
MWTPPGSLREHPYWVRYPLLAVLLGGVLGWAAGRHPRGPDPLMAVSPRGSDLLVDACRVLFAFSVAVVALFFLLGLLGGERGVRSRLTNGLGAAAFAASVVLIFAGGGFVLCSGLALLSLWAGMGAGPLVGAVLGALSVGLAIGLGLLCLRPVGRVLVRKKLEAVANAEEDSH